MKLPILLEQQITHGLIPLNAEGRYVYNGATVGTLVIQGDGTPVDGAHAVVRVPAGKATADVVASGLLNIRRPPSFTFDDAADTVVEFEVRAFADETLIEGTLTQVPPADLSLPTVVSADATASQTTLTVVFSKAVLVSSLAGLSLSFTTGTARTLSSVASGNGTNTIVFNLSGALAASDVFSFVVAAAPDTEDLYGQDLQAGSTLVDVDPGAVMPSTGTLLQAFNAVQQASISGTTWIIEDKSGANNHGEATAIFIPESPIVLTSAPKTYDLGTFINSGIMTNDPIPSGAFGFGMRIKRLRAWLTDDASFFGSNNDNNILRLHMVGGALRLRQQSVNYDTAYTPVIALNEEATIYYSFNPTGGVVNLYWNDMDTPIASFSGVAAPTGNNLTLGCVLFNNGLRQGIRNYAIHSSLLNATERAQLSAWWNAVNA